MKKLLIAIVFVFLAALTETTEDYILSRGSDPELFKSYASAWSKAETQGLIFDDQDETVLDVQSELTNLDPELHPAAI